MVVGVISHILLLAYCWPIVEERQALCRVSFS